MKLDSRYGEYFPEYYNYFGRPLILKKSVYGMNNSGNLVFLQANVKHNVFVKLESIYGLYFPDYDNCFGISLILNNSMFGMNKYGYLLIN